jgi:aminoglycoside phosphotransferase (APT) family kinase protein
VPNLLFFSSVVLNYNMAQQDTPSTPASELTTPIPSGTMKRHDSPTQEDSEAASTTSTVDFAQESYSTFQNKVTQLMLSIYTSHTDAGDITLERMQVGSFNRIIGVTISESASKIAWYNIPARLARSRSVSSSQTSDYILRIPRDTSRNMYYQVIALQYLRQKLSYPIPNIVVYDSTASNALGQPYMLQDRLPGQPLSQLWTTLNLEQRRCAARCVAEVVRDLHTVKDSRPGVLSTRNTPLDLSTDLPKLDPIPIDEHVLKDKFGLPAPKYATPQTTRALLLDLCERQRAAMAARDLSHFDNVWTSFVGMINKLHALDVLPDKDSFHLYYADFQSRNLMFTTPSPSTVRLTGILDWDSALFAPKFMSTRVPFFLWTDEGADELEEGDVLLESSDAEVHDYKRIFEAVVGEKFCEDAYRPVYIFARRVWRFLVGGIRSGGDAFLAEMLVEEWEENYPTAGPQ